MPLMSASEPSRLPVRISGTSEPHAGVGRDLVSLLLRLYRQGDAALRARCLDVIDRMCELNVYDVERALDDSRQ